MRPVAIVLLAILAGCGYEPPGKPNPADRPVLPAQRTNFEYLYTQNCSGCHGANGTLGPAPPLNDPIFLAIVSDEDLVRVITDGRAGTPMPAFARKNQGTLTEQQIRIIAAGLKKHWSSDKLPKEKLPPYAVASADEPPSATNVERGAKIFQSACATCHGANEKPADLRENRDKRPGPLNSPDLLTLISNQALRRIVITGRHDLGMPNFADDEGRPPDFEPLSSDDIGDLVALLASWRQGAAPAAEETAR